MKTLKRYVCFEFAFSCTSKSIIHCFNRTHDECVAKVCFKYVCAEFVFSCTAISITHCFNYTHSESVEKICVVILDLHFDVL